MDVYSYIMTIVKNKDMAEELAQETFFKAMNSEFKGKSSERTWLNTIAKNICMDEFRARKRETSIEDERDVVAKEADIDVEGYIFTKMQGIEIHMALHELEE